MGKAFHIYLRKIKFEGKGYTLRTFRKDFISRCQEAVVSINATSILVGHSNIKTTMIFYTKLCTNHLQNELKQINIIFASKEDSCGVFLLFDCDSLQKSSPILSKNFNLFIITYGVGAS